MRVVSLVPSSTETLLALGADVVACSRFCEQPGIDHVGGTKNPDIQAIVDLAPDLVVLDREENRIEDHDALVAAGLRVFTSDVTDLDSAISVVGELAEATDVTARIDLTVPPPFAGGRRTAFVPIWRRPWMTISAGTYGASLLARLGIDLVTVSDPAPYPVVELDEIGARRPRLVIVPSEPYEFNAGHLAEMAEAVPHARIVEVDGRDLFWWGVRTPGAVSRLGEALAPRLPPGRPIRR